MATTTFQADDGAEYEILSDALGRGGQGTVHVGRRRGDDGAVAIKRILGGATRGPDRNRELQIALKLGQRPPQRLVAPLTWAVDGEDLLLVMPLADRSLADELAEHRGGLSEGVQLAVLRDITTGLAQLHSAGIVHRDLKPGNVLLYAGRWHMADFGISRDLDVRTATVTFQHAGTAPYTAPERWRGQPATHKSDLYALGCIAHELATGIWPFPGRDLAEQQHQHLHTPPPATPVSPSLARWILRLLDKDPARRPQDAEAARATLPATPTQPAGQLAAAALQLAQHRQQQGAGNNRTISAAEARAVERRQALADLADICASAADRVRPDLPDLRWDNHGDVQRFHVDDIRLDLALWMEPAMREEDGLVLAGEVSAIVNGRRRCVANLVGEVDDGQQRWYLDTFTRHPFTRGGGPPVGFSANEFFTHYRKARQEGDHSWIRQRQPLSPDLIVGILTELLLEAAQP